jgi:ribosomal protein L18
LLLFIQNLKQEKMKKLYIHFIPKGDGDAVLWFKNYKEKISIWGPQLGLTAVQITEQETAADLAIDAITAAEVQRRDLEEAVKAKNAARITASQAVGKVIASLKKNDAYTEAIGGSLGIIGYSRLYDLKEIRPVIKATAYSGRVDIAFNLQVMKSITIYSRIKGTYGWEKLGNDYATPFEDRRPLAVAQQAEIREYMAFYFNGKEDIGKQSDIVSAVFGG